MKKITLWLFAFFASWQINAQVSINEGFEATTTPTGWTYASFIRSTVTPCVGVASVRRNFWASGSTGSVTTVNFVAGSNGEQIDISFDWQTTEYSLGDGVGVSMDVQYSTDNGTNWNTIGNISSNTITPCTTWTGSLPAGTVPNGSDFRMRFNGTHTGGDCYFYIDNIQVTQQTFVAPNCTSIISPADGAVNVSSGLISWSAATGAPTGYKLNVGTSAGATDVLNGADVGNVTSYDIGTLTGSTTYYVTIIPYNANGDAIGCTETSFSSCFINIAPWSYDVEAAVATTNASIADCWSTIPVGPTTAAYRWNVDAAGGTPTGPNTGPSGANSGVKYFYTEASSGATGAVAELYTPLVDLSGLTDPSLQFFYHMHGANMGELRVDVFDGTTWTNDVFILTGVQQTANTQPWSEAIVSLNAYIGNTVQVRFRSIRGNGINSDMALDDITFDEAPSCFDPINLGAANITATTVDVLFTDGSAGNQFDFAYVVQPQGTGAPGTYPAGTPEDGSNQINATDFSIPVSGLNSNTPYEIYIAADCNGNWIGPFNFRTNIDVVCGTPVNTTHCYTNNDTTTWTFTSDDASPLRITFNAGGMESCCDEIIIYDGTDTTGVILYQGNNGGNLAGLTFDSTTDSIHIVIDADSSISCGSGSTCCTAQFDFTVVCATCVNPTATFTTVPDCANGEYSIDVDLTDLGTATSVTISDGTTTLTNINATGIQTFGPYLSGSSATIIITNEQDNSCTLSSGTVLYDCPPSNDECSGAIALTVNSDFNCGVQTPGTIAAATASAVDAAACFGTENDDVWFSFVATATSHRIQLNNVVGSTTDLYHSLWTGTDCGTLTLVPGTCSDPNTSNPTGLTIGQTYYLRVYSWANASHNTTFNVCIGTPPPPAANDDLCNAISLTVNAVSTGTQYNNIGATAEPNEPIAGCFSDGINGSVWFSFVAPASGEVIITTDIAGASVTDTEIALYDATGVTCSDLSTLGAPIACDQDGGTTINYNSIITQAGLTPGNTYYIQVDDYGFGTSQGSFGIEVQEVLSSDLFDNNNFTAYPNPVKDILNLSYTSEITSVQVINMLGQVVISRNLNATNAQLDMSQLSAGTYIVNVAIGDTVKTIKVVKQ